MDRRDFMLASGVLAFAGTSQAAPDAGAAGKAPGLVELGSTCIQVGEECQAHCLQQFSASDTSLAACAKSVSVMRALPGPDPVRV